MKEIQTASGIVKMAIYEAEIAIYNQIFNIEIISAPISDQLPFHGLVGRNLLDFFNLYLLGKKQIVCVK